MSDYLFDDLSTVQQEKVIGNAVEAFQILHSSVKERKEKEFLEKMQNEKNEIENKKSI